jgi:hypothetical protein
MAVRYWLKPVVVCKPSLRRPAASWGRAPAQATRPPWQWAPCGWVLMTVCWCWVLAQVEQSTRSTNKSLQRLMNVAGVPPEKIYEALCKQKVELVFTAHPTQVRILTRALARGLGDAPVVPECPP